MGGRLLSILQTRCLTRAEGITTGGVTKIPDSSQATPLWTMVLLGLSLDSLDLLFLIMLWAIHVESSIKAEIVTTNNCKFEIIILHEHTLIYINNHWISISKHFLLNNFELIL